ncbi:MAG: MMPL family transporter [Archangium sp.]|nr:MMPL family transporter [Archangium sp.]
MSDKSAFLSRAAAAYARLIVNNPGRVLTVLLVLGVIATYLTTQLTIESDQLSLISQELPEVKNVKRVIDMVGGAGHLMLTLRADDVETLKQTADAVNEVLTTAKQPDGTPYVRALTYKVPIDFIQENMVLFIKTEDLQEGRRRLTPYIKDQIRRMNPFFLEIRKTEPVKLELEDLISKYASVGKKSIRDSYYISDDKQMMMMLIKPMWTSTELAKTKEFIDVMTGEAPIGQPVTKGLLFDAAQKAKRTLVEDYQRMGDTKTVAFGFTGSYKTGVDDSYAMKESLDDVFIWAFTFIVIITILFFRKWAPTLIVISGMALGTVLTMGFAKLTLGELNMITSIIGAILMGFGIDYGIHFIYRTRIELGAGKRYDVAITDALINAGRPAFIAAIVTAGSFFVLLVSGFRGFSQFGFLAGFGTLIIGLTLFAWSPAILSLLGRRDPELPRRLIGEMKPPSAEMVSGETRIRSPKLLLGLALVVVGAVCAFSVPWVDEPLPKDREPTMFERLRGGTRFNYNTRALAPDEQPSIKLQDEISRRYDISSDPIAVVTSSIEEAKDIWDAMTLNPETGFNINSEKYKTVDQVVSIYSFVPPPETAQANAAVLAEWREELKDIDIGSLPPDLQEKAGFFKRVLEKKPFGVNEVPRLYAELFESLPTTRPENKGYLTYLYPKVDLWDGKNLLAFADETHIITGKSGKEYQAAGLATVYARLARIVLFDGKLTVVLAALWILLMHFLDFRSVKLALASVIPLGIGLWMMLGTMSITNHRLNFMNLVILPILLGFGVSHGLYLLHRFLEGVSPMVALRSVGAAVASSTLTAIAGFASLFFAEHNGLRSIGFVACIGLATTLIVSFTVLAAVLQLIYDKQGKQKLGEGT